MKLTSLLLLASLTLGLHFQPAYAAELCNAAELVKGEASYDQLVCKGISALKAKDYPSAIQSLESAAAIHFVDIPNYKLFPKIAYSYFKTGNMEKASAYLEKARLSLSVSVGIMHCQEADSGFYIAQFATQKVDSTQAQDVVRAMCGEAYQDAYDSRTLEAVVSDARLIEYYLAVKADIQKSKKN